ncbi:MAG: hypothetical protein H0U04_05420 [Rubrobacter sp.]|nr:hypothetical protein [Rubrobacter sp.]
MTEVFTRYGGGGPRPAYREPIACVVAHPDAGGRCEREAVGEVWRLPFCEVHGREAELAYMDEINDAVRAELDALGDAENQKPGSNEALLEALARTPTPPGVDRVIHLAAMEEAYPPDELEGNTDPDMLRFDYETHGRDTPYDWWCEARIMAVRFMCEAQSVPILKDLELVRERATVQELLASRDMDRRCKPARV